MKLLIPENPIPVLPSLAKEIGLNEAIVVQQLHYWTARKEPDEHGERWVWNTLADWIKQFPWLTEPTLRRVLKRLREERLIDVRQPGGQHRVNHYRLLYENLPSHTLNMSASSDHSGGFSNTTETSTEKQAGAASSSPTCSDEVQSVWSHYETLFPEQAARGRGLTDSKVRIVKTALKEYAAADLCRALDGLKRHREGPGKGRSVDIAAALKTNPKSGPLHEHIAFWIDYAEKGARPKAQGDDLDIKRVREEQGLD